MAFSIRAKKRGALPGSTAALVAQAQEDPARFAALYQQYVQPVYRYIYRRVGNQQEAEDLTGQTFLSALQALPGCRDREHFPAWLFTIARNKVMDYFRHHSRELDMEFPAHLASQSDLQEQVFQDLEVQRLSALVGRLEEEEQELIRLRYVAGLTFPEIAVLLGRKEDAVKKELYRLLARLRSQMEVRNE